MYFMQNIFIILLLGILINYGNPTLELEIFHTGDIHSRFEKVAKIVAFIKERRHEKPNGTLYFDTGDIFQGSIWFVVAGWRIAAEFMKLLHPDAYSIGNHEFDQGITNLTKYLDFLDRPILCANCDVSRVPPLRSKVMPTQILQVHGIDIGIIGYLDKMTQAETAQNFGLVRLLDEKKTIRKYVRELKGQGVKIIILLGHGGYALDKEIAAHVQDIDIIIGGHSHTYLYGPIPEGSYPTVIKNPLGVKVPIVHVFYAAEYVGHLKVKFDNAGNLISFSGHPIPVHDLMKTDHEAQAILQEYNETIQAYKRIILGNTKTLINGESYACRQRECNMGNFLADTFVLGAAVQRKKRNFFHFPIGLVNSGSIKASIPAGNITYAHLLEVMPYGNEIVILGVNGSALLEALEHSVCCPGKGHFLQYSGLHVTYDLSKKVGARVVSARVRCSNCLVPSYLPLNVSRYYRVVTIAFLSTGGDEFHMLEDSEIKDPEIGGDVEVLTQYLKHFDFVYPQEEERITILKSSASLGRTLLFILFVNYLLLKLIKVM